jgi:putative Holliday junction resolvase
MKTAGLDIGAVRIGIAISDERGILANGVESYACSGNIEADAKSIAQKIDAFGVGTIVVGLPKNMNNTEGPAAQKVRAFAQKLAKYTKAGISFYDERLTTAQAERILIYGRVRRNKRRQVIDKLAAQIILQSYLDTKEDSNV